MKKTDYNEMHFAVFVAKLDYLTNTYSGHFMIRYLYIRGNRSRPYYNI